MSSDLLNPEGGRPPFAPRFGEAFWVLALVFACAACGGDPRASRPLLTSEHVPDVLVESKELSLRPTHDGNRFLSGWRPLRRFAELTLSPAQASVRLEFVQLANRPRMLALDLVAAPPSGEHIELTVAGRPREALPAADPLEIPLPADLPLGRQWVELYVDPEAFAVRAAHLRPALPAGEASEQGGALVQSGFSRVDMVRWVKRGESLSGRFAPPTGARSEQIFAVKITHPNGLSTPAFRWSPGLLDRLRSPYTFDIPLEESGLVRLSFEARGEGPAGRWSELRLRAPAAEPPRPAGASSGPVARVEPPEIVILYVMDALRADAVTHLGGLPGTTPVLDRLAREGMSFGQHRSPAPNTLPSTKALLTGEAWVDRGGWKLPAEGGATLAELFRRAGYRTGLFSGNVYVGPSYGVERGFEKVVEAPLEEARAPYNDNAERLHDAALAWLGTLSGSDRAFLYLHTIHPHNPYDPPEPYRSQLVRDTASEIDGSTRTLLDLSRRRREAREADREKLRRLYAASLAYNDAELGQLLRRIQELFPRKRLFLAVTSDHGEELFEHGGVLHGYTLYEEMIRIPLILWSRGPDGRQNRASAPRAAPEIWPWPTSTLDLHATLAELAAGSSSERGEGRSLLPILRGIEEEPAAMPAVHLAAAASVKGGIFSIQSARFKLIWAPRTGRHWGQGGIAGRSRSPEYLFNLVEDPGERLNRTGEGGLEVAWLRSRLRAWIRAKKAPQEAVTEAVPDEATRRRLEALGYVD